MRAAVNRNTGFTANRLMLGRETNQPADLVFPLPCTNGDQPGEEYVRGLEQSLKHAHEVARRTLKTTQERMKRDYDLRVHAHAYDVGDCVYVLDTATVKGKCRKLSPPWKGPGVIIANYTAALYKVKLRRGEMNVNHDRIKLCRDHQLPSWLERFLGNLKEERGVGQSSPGASYIAYAGDPMMVV